MKTKRINKPLSVIPGIGAVREHRLKEVGITTIEAVAESAAHELIHRLNINQQTALNIIREAQYACGMRRKKYKKLELLDLPPDLMASAYIDGHLIIQVQCSEEEAEAIMKSITEFEEIRKKIDENHKQVKENAKTLEELGKQMDKLSGKPKSDDSVMYV